MLNILELLIIIITFAIFNFFVFIEGGILLFVLGVITALSIFLVKRANQLKTNHFLNVISTVLVVLVSLFVIPMFYLTFKHAFISENYVSIYFIIITYLAYNIISFKSNTQYKLNNFLKLCLNLYIIIISFISLNINLEFYDYTNDNLIYFIILIFTIVIHKLFSKI